MSADHLSDLQLDRVLADGTADPHLAECPVCQARRDELATDRAAFARRFDVRELADATAPKPRFPWLWLVPVAAALLAGLFLTREAPPDTRTKGATTLELFLDGPEPTRADVVEPGSRLRLRFDPRGRRHARILWSGPAGVEALDPALDEPALSLLDPHGPRWMAHTIQLDDEPEDEALIAVFCDTPFDHAEALAQLKDGDCDVARLPVRKAR